jgi:hypothetical protein
MKENIGPWRHRRQGLAIATSASLRVFYWVGFTAEDYGEGSLKLPEARTENVPKSSSTPIPFPWRRQLTPG